MMTAHNRNDLVIEQSHADIIWWAAWMSLGASVHAVYIQQSGFAVVPACVLVTSLNYWRNPVRNSLRRTADMSTVLPIRTGIQYDPFILSPDIFQLHFCVGVVFHDGAFVHGAQHAAHCCIRTCRHPRGGKHGKHCPAARSNDDNDNTNTKAAIKIF